MADNNIWRIPDTDVRGWLMSLTGLNPGTNCPPWFIWRPVCPAPGLLTKVIRILDIWLVRLSDWRLLIGCWEGGDHCPMWCPMASVIMPHSPWPRHGLLLFWCGNGSHSCQVFWQSLEYQRPNHLQIYRWMFNEYLKMDHIVTSRFRVLTETLKLFSERMLSERDFELLDPLYSENLPG